MKQISMLWTHPEINDQTKTFSMSYFDKKVVLVTGASTGLGWYLARAFATHGAEVVITARGAERLKEAADALCSEGGTVSAIAADVTADEQVDRLFAQLNERYERLDVLVNNVGRSTRGLASETSPEQFRELFELNFLSLVRCTRALFEPEFRSTYNCASHHRCCYSHDQENENEEQGFPLGHFSWIPW